MSKASTTAPTGSNEELAAQVAALSAQVAALIESGAQREQSLEDRIKALTKNEAATLAKQEQTSAEDGLRSAAEAFSATELPEGCVWAQKGGDRMPIINHPVVIAEHKALGWATSGS